MASMMRGAGFDPQASPFGGSTPIAPGNPNVPPASNTTSTTTPPVGGPPPGGTSTTPNVLGGDPNALLQLLGGVTPPSAGARPPEERFQVQLQVLHFVILRALGLTCILFIAITRHGLHQCLAECARPTCDRRKRAFGDRVYPRRWWIVVQETP